MIAFEGTVWRLVFADRDPLAPAASPEGRFHHAGQRALYASLTPEGAAVAIRRYLAPGQPPRVLVPLSLRLDRLADQRGNLAASIVWQDQRAEGKPSTTWAYSDAARAMGAQAMMYSSRSRPDLTHLVLFDDARPLIRSVGQAQPWHP